MSLWKRLFGKLPEVEPVKAPDDRHLSEVLGNASEKHKRETLDFKRSSIRQIEEADYIRETLRGVLSRIEERKEDGKAS